MYAAIRQGKARTGVAEELAVRIKEGAIPIISDVPGFKAYYVVYAPDDTVTAISIFDNYEAAEESNRRGLVWIEQIWAAACCASDGRGRAGDRTYIGIAHSPSSFGHSNRCTQVHQCPMSSAMSSASRLRFARSTP